MGKHQLRYDKTGETEWANLKASGKTLSRGELKTTAARATTEVEEGGTEEQEGKYTQYAR